MNGEHTDRLVIYVDEPSPPSPPSPPAPPAGPCRVTRGQHRWAWLTASGQACGYCGQPR